MSVTLFIFIKACYIIYDIGALTWGVVFSAMNYLLLICSTLDALFGSSYVKRGDVPVAALCGNKVAHCLCTLYFGDVSGTHTLVLNVCDVLLLPSTARLGARQSLTPLCELMCTALKCRVKCSKMRRDAL